MSGSSAIDASRQRGRLRERRLLYNAGTLLAAKAVSAVAALISLPLTLGYLGPERYGMWATISAAILIFNLADLGIGNGMLNRVSEAFGRKDWNDIRTVAGNATVLLALICAALIGALGLSYAFVPWHEIYNVQSEVARAEAGPATALFVLFWSLRLPLTIVQRVQFGMQMGHVSNLWDVVGSLGSLAAIVLATQLDAGVYWLVAAFAGVPMLTLLANNLVFYRWMRPEVRPRLRSARIADAVPIIKAGLLILTLQLTGALVVASDSLVIAQVLGAEAVAPFAVADRLFSLIPVVVMVVSHSLWPAIAEANARGDLTWIKRSFARAMLFAFVVSAGLSLVLVVFTPQIVSVWIRDAVQPATALLVAIGVWKVIESTSATVSIYLNARGILRPQLLPAVLLCVVAITLKFVLVAYMGAAGALWASTIGYALTMLVPQFRLVRRSLANDRRVEAQTG